MEESSTKTLCNNFAQILGGCHSFQKNMCIVEVTRNIQLTIMGHPSPTTSFGFFAFVSINKKNEMELNIGDFPLLEKEVNPFIQELRMQGIKISAVKAHWLFNEPKLFHVNFRSIDEPLSFAKKVRNAINVLS